MVLPRWRQVEILGARTTASPRIYRDQEAVLIQLCQQFRHYIKDDNTKASGEWLQFSDATYWIDSNGYMATGWRKYNNGAWYYFKSSGVMAKNTWIEDNSKWFYLGGEGYMLKDTIIDGRYRLNAEGVWIQ